MAPSWPEGARPPPFGREEARRCRWVYISRRRRPIRTHPDPFFLHDVHAFQRVTFLYVLLARSCFFSSLFLLFSLPRLLRIPPCQRYVPLIRIGASRLCVFSYSVVPTFPIGWSVGGHVSGAFQPCARILSRSWENQAHTSSPNGNPPTNKGEEKKTGMHATWAEKPVQAAAGRDAMRCHARARDKRADTKRACGSGTWIGKRQYLYSI